MNFKVGSEAWLAQNISNLCNFLKFSLLDEAEKIVLGRHLHFDPDFLSKILTMSDSVFFSQEGLELNKLICFLIKSNRVEKILSIKVDKIEINGIIQTALIENPSLDIFRKPVSHLSSFKVVLKSSQTVQAEFFENSTFRILGDDESKLYFLVRIMKEFILWERHQRKLAT
jgi:hypothetical protein